MSGFATREILLWRYHIISSLGKKYSISARYLCKDFPYRWFLTVRFFFDWKIKRALALCRYTEGGYFSQKRNETSIVKAITCTTLKYRYQG